MKKPIFSTSKKVRKRIEPKQTRLEKMKSKLSTWELIQFENKMINKYGQLSA